MEYVGTARASLFAARGIESDMPNPHANAVGDSSVGGKGLTLVEIRPTREKERPHSEFEARRVNDVYTIAFIGGMKFDAAAVDEWLELGVIECPLQIVMGKGRGAEKYVAEKATELGLSVTILEPEPWHSKAAEVERLMMGVDAIVLVGSGGRVLDAEKVYKRTDAWRNYPRPFTQIGALTIEPVLPGAEVATRRVRGNQASSGSK